MDSLLFLSFLFSGVTIMERPLAWGSTGSVRQTARNRLKIGVRREGTVSDDILETRRLTSHGRLRLRRRSVWARVAFPFLA